MMESQQYLDFVEKFKPKKTTDDCYTPEPIYDAVAQYVRERYDPDGRAEFVRPFWPGGNFETFDYPEGCIVVDNPPFSLVAQIVRFYKRNGIRYFLFVPGLMPWSVQEVRDEIQFVGRGVATLVYANGAGVCTAYRTNMGDAIARTAPRLTELLVAAVAKMNAGKKTLPKQDFPDSIMTANRMMQAAGSGRELAIRHGAKLSRLDAGVELFGGGYLVTRLAAERLAAERLAAERLAAERLAAERLAAAEERHVYTLSPREVEMQKLIERQEARESADKKETVE